MRIFPLLVAGVLALAAPISGRLAHAGTIQVDLTNLVLKPYGGLSTPYRPSLVFDVDLNPNFFPFRGPSGRGSLPPFDPQFALAAREFEAQGRFDEPYTRIDAQLKGDITELVLQGHIVEPQYQLMTTLSIMARPAGVSDRPLVWDLFDAPTGTEFRLDAPSVSVFDSGRQIERPGDPVVELISFFYDESRGSSEGFLLIRVLEGPTPTPEIAVVPLPLTGGLLLISLIGFLGLRGGYRRV